MLVTVENGRAVLIGGEPERPVTQGFLCTKVSKYLERTYHDGLLLYIDSSAHTREARRRRQ